ncbi:MAG: flagellar hook-length control protein FliK [Porticoccus sp.]
MSGITPLIDTLLHQVLGKRVDLPQSRALNQPVQSGSEASAGRPVYSDSRLNAQPNSPQLPPTEKISIFHPVPTVVKGASETPSFVSVETTLSPTARAISTILSNRSSQPSAIHQLKPLLRDSGELSASLLSGKLHASIRDSGLFYESHLARWYRGSLPRQQLDREPQMRFLLKPIQIMIEDESLPKMTQEKLQPDLKPSVLNTFAKTPALIRSTPLSIPVDADIAGSRQIEARKGLLKGLGGSESNKELQGIVRHQLELLSTPLLHWEGEVWSGVFMALLIQIPEMVAGRHGSTEQDESTESDKGNDSWDSELILNLQNIGVVKMKIMLKDQALTLWLQAPTDEVLQQLDGKKEALLGRLQACGFDNMALHIQVAEDDNV